MQLDAMLCGPTTGADMQAEEFQARIAAALRARRLEIELAVMERIAAVSDPSERIDLEYTERLRAAVVAAVDHGIDALERGPGQAPPIPLALVSLARLSARNRVSLEAMLRRCFAGYSALGNFIVEEAENYDLRPGASLKELMRVQADTFERVIAAISDEHSREAGGGPKSAEQRRVESVERLLAGEPSSFGEVDYDFDAQHLGVIAAGREATVAIRELAGRLDCRLLLISYERESLWAWLGTRRDEPPDALDRAVSECVPAQVALAVGELGWGIEGWRLTHRQARMAFSVAIRGSKPFVRYADVALSASALGDGLLVASLHQLYLLPLSKERDGGATLRRTLRAYFAAERNTSSAAAALGVHRDTVAGRLRVAEEKIGRPLARFGADLELALRLDHIAAGRGR
jgi:hypothetical protein